MYFNGKRLEADDDYRFYIVKGEVYLVNTKGKIQKATGDGKKYDDIENKEYSNDDDVVVVTNKSGVVQSVDGVGVDALKTAIVYTSVDDIVDDKASDSITVPFIALFDNVFTYTDSLGNTGWR